MDAQLAFLLAADGLKGVNRHNKVHNGTRQENSAEHSWHLTLMAITFAEHAPPDADIPHIIQLLIAHDLVEVGAGDHWVLASDPEEVAAKEAVAAQELFSLLPADQATHLHTLWREFEARETPEARFAKALDALHPMLMIWGPGGTDYIHTPLTAATLRDLKRPLLEHFPPLWAVAQALLDGAVSRGALPAK